MLSFQLGTHHVHALAFSPDGRRLAAACGRNVTVVDWSDPGEPAWIAPPTRAPSRATTLAFQPDGLSVLSSYGGQHLYDFGLAHGKSSPVSALIGNRRTPWSVTVVAGGNPATAIVIGYPNPRGDRQVLVLPIGSEPRASLANPRSVGWRDTGYPLGAWTDGSRLLVWTMGLLNWFRWPPPPLPLPPSRWHKFTSTLTGLYRIPPELEMLVEHPFPFIDAPAVAPLPDGESVLVVSRGAIIRWHAPSGRELSRLRWPGVQSLRSLAVSPDGTVAAVGANNGRVIVWDLDG